MPMVKKFSMCFDVFVVVVSVPECHLNESDCALQTHPREKPTSAVPSGAGLVSMTSDSDYKFTSSAIPSARNMVSIQAKTNSTSELYRLSDRHFSTKFSANFCG
jgi:hypothetical protein